MRKVLLATLDFPPMIGGVAEYLYGLAASLPADRVAVLADDSSPELHGTSGEGECLRAAFPVRRAKLLAPHGRPLRWLAAIGPVARALKAEKAETLVVSHILPMGYVARLLKLLLGVPYVVLTHGTDLNFAGRSAWRRFWASVVLEGAELVVTNSRYTRGLALRMGASEERLETVYPCPALGHSAPEEASHTRHELGLEGKKVILMVNRLVRRKGVDRMIRALRRVRESCGEAVLVVVGAGPELDELKRETERFHVRPHVLFRPDVPRGKMRAFYAAADVLVLPARLVKGDVEGFGIALVEAQSHGVPVVTTRVGGIPEAVKEGESAIVLAEGASEAELAEAVGSILHDPARAAEMAEAGRRLVRETFSWPIQAAKLIARL